MYDPCDYTKLVYSEIDGMISYLKTCSESVCSNDISLYTQEDLREILYEIFQLSDTVKKITLGVCEKVLETNNY